MELKELASVSGKGGLFRILKPGKAGVLLEALDETKSRVVVGADSRVSILDEISLYTLTKEGSSPLRDVLKKIYKDFGNDAGIDANSDPAELKAFLKSVLPEYDEERVYVSDIRKLIKWYGLIVKYAPEILTAEKAEKKEEKSEKKEEKSAKKK